MSRIAPFAVIAGVTTGALVTRERQSRRAMERLAAATLESLLYAIDANDADTGAHVRRVAAYALVLAEEAGLDEHQRHVVERVALFHDIGKIHSALFDIIHENTTLTPAERRAIATHPARGARVLAPIASFYPDLAEGVIAHHERWDGKGYPRGLHGPRIPLSARIVAIADSFDVISHGRRYQRGRSLERAAELIARGRATQFDPSLVDLFLFPPVFARIREAQRALCRPRIPASQDRRTEVPDSEAPDVTFRWRSRTPAIAGASPGASGAKR
jgi:HD-GYP domain-containing protein (c-di-GMP phosphodiesterase class II)